MLGKLSDYGDFISINSIQLIVLDLEIFRNLISRVLFLQTCNSIRLDIDISSEEVKPANTDIPLFTRIVAAIQLFEADIDRKVLVYG